MHCKTYLLAMLMLLVAVSGNAADAPKKEQDLSVVLDGQLLPIKARRLGDGIYIEIGAIGKVLNWDMQSSDSIIAIKTNQALTRATAKVSGTITYYFNRNYGNKPDTGSKVLLIQHDPSFSPQAEDMFLALEPNVRLKKKSGEDHSFAIVAATAVDGNGRYELNSLKPGKYILIIQSSHARGMDSLNVLGKVFTIALDIAAGDSRDMSHDFGMTSF